MSGEKKKSTIASAGVALAVAAAVLLPLGGFMVWRLLLEQPGMSAQPEETGAEQTPGAGKKVVAREFANGDDDTPRRTVAVVKPPAPKPPEPKPAVRVPSRPVDIPVGLEKSKLIASYGRPQMITTELENGQAVETFHYLQRDTGTETIVRLLAGRVVSTGTTDY